MNQHLKKSSTWLICLMGLLCGSSTSATPQSPPSTKAPLGTLTIRLTGFRTDNGVARVAIFPSADGFPGKAKNAIHTSTATIRQRACSTMVKQLKPGTYAVAVIHDENKNGKLDTNWLGIPKEGIGVSNNATSNFGPPKYKKAKFNFEPPQKEISIKIKYIF